MRYINLHLHYITLHLQRAGGRRVFLCLCIYLCYHDNSNLRASILTKLGLWVKVVTLSSWLNFGRPAPP